MMKTCITICTFASLVFTSSARPVVSWPYDQLTEKADIIVIATPSATRGTAEAMNLPGIQRAGTNGVSRPVPGFGQETTFEVLTVFKGDKSIKSLVVFHLREAEPQIVSVNGPGLISFEPNEKKRYLLFLKRDPDGRFSSLTGQTDPIGAVKDLGVYP